MPGYLGYAYYQLSMVQPTGSYNDLMAAVVSRLKSAIIPVLGTTVGYEFGDSATTPKFHADEIDPDVPVPYLLHSDPSETPQRHFQGRVGQGTFELGVYSSGYETSLTLMGYVQQAIDSWITSPIALTDGGSLFYCKSMEGVARSVRVTAPGSSVSHFGRMLQFAFKIARN